MIFRNGVSNIVSNAIQRGAVLLLYIFAARSMDDHAFGLASSLVTLAITIGSLSSLSLGHAANRTLSRLRVKRAKERMAAAIVQISFLIAICAAILFFIFHVSLTRAVTGEATSYIDAFSISIAVFGMGFGTCLKGLLHAEFRYGILLASSVVSTVALFGSYVAFAAMGSDLPLLHAYTAMLLAEVSVLVMAVVSPLMSCCYFLKLPGRWFIGPILRFSSLATLNGLVFTPVNVVLISFITAEFGAGTAGRFNMLVQIRNAITFVPSGFSSVLLTIMSKSRLPSRLLLNSLMLGSMAALASVPVIAVAYFLRPKAAGNEYLIMLLITAVTAVVIALGINVGQVFVAFNRLWLAIASNLFLAVVTLSFVGLVLLLHGETLNAILVAILLAHVFHLIFQVFFGQKFGNGVTQASADL